MKDWVLQNPGYTIIIIIVLLGVIENCVTSFNKKKSDKSTKG